MGRIKALIAMWLFRPSKKATLIEYRPAYQCKVCGAGPERLTVNWSSCGKKKRNSPIRVRIGITCRGCGHATVYKDLGDQGVRVWSELHSNAVFQAAS